MQYIDHSYDIGETLKKVWGPASLSTLKSKVQPKNNHETSRYFTIFHLPKNRWIGKKMTKLQTF